MVHQDDGRPAKRSRPDDGVGSGDSDNEGAAGAVAAWEHYRNFIDGDAAEGEGADGEEGEEAEGGGDIDELLELIGMLEDVPPLSVDPSATDDDGASKLQLGTLDILLPVLLSMSHLNLASHAISEVMFDPNQPKDASTREEDEESSPEYHFGKALHYWPTNPAAHSLLANYHRMNALSSTKDICEKYEKAVEYAKWWRRMALDFLQQSEFDGQILEGVNAKEWVELLIANGALDVDYIGEDDECEEEDGNAEEQKEDEEQGEEYSCSGVECTASFMAAFLLSTLGKHDEALSYLRKFGLSHRIHPNVWRDAGLDSGEATGAATNDSGQPGEPTAKFLPRMYRGTDSGQGGVLPPQLYNRLCTLFAPDATYWKESDYNNRGYYSYFIDLDTPADSSPSVRERPTNVIEDAIVNHLLPLAERTLSENAITTTTPRIVGAEWWVHTRPLGANLGHQVHFDTDEGLLSREKRVSHPIVSSVLYLTGASKGNEGAGATVVFDQSPESKEVAPRAWISHPQNNAYMTFSGDLLHGVLPCSGTSAKENGNNTSRLTFMVGFWTRNVAEGMGERELYSPSGPLPPATKDHTWVAECQRGYEGKGPESSSAIRDAQNDLAFDHLPSTSPAWEQFDSEEKAGAATDDGPPLTIPKGLDHRFFVRGAPHCFSESLFEQEECF